MSKKIRPPNPAVELISSKSNFPRKDDVKLNIVFLIEEYSSILAPNDKWAQDINAAKTITTTRPIAKRSLADEVSVVLSIAIVWLYRRMLRNCMKMMKVASPRKIMNRRSANTTLWKLTVSPAKKRVLMHCPSVQFGTVDLFK